MVHGTASAIYHPTFGACARRVLAVSASFVGQPVCLVPQRTSTGSPIRVRVSSLVSQSVSHRSLLDRRAATPRLLLRTVPRDPLHSLDPIVRVSEAAFPISPGRCSPRIRQAGARASVDDIVNDTGVARWQLLRTPRRFRRWWTINLTRRDIITHPRPANDIYRAR